MIKATKGGSIDAGRRDFNIDQFNKNKGVMNIKENIISPKNTKKMKLEINLSKNKAKINKKITIDPSKTAVSQIFDRPPADPSKQIIKLTDPQPAGPQSVIEPDPTKFQVKFPMSNTDVLTHLSQYLVDYEKSEILKYPTIYYINLLERKKEGGLPRQEGKGNDGWSKENGEFIFEIHDMIGYRYDIIRTLGNGSFGVVFKCYDYKTKDFIALKVVRCKKKLQKQGMVEFGLLKHLRDHDPDDKKNVVKIKEHFYWRNHL